MKFLITVELDKQMRPHKRKHPPSPSEFKEAVEKFRRRRQRR